MENPKIIKDDINFLEYPNWVVSRNNKTTTLKIQKPHGNYEIISPFGLPKHLDKIVLYFLLHKLYREKNLDSYVLTTNRYEIAKNIFPTTKDCGKARYARIMTSLKTWQALSITFDGLFYGEDGPVIKGFSIIDEYTLRKTSGELVVKFNESYIKQLKETKFYKLIDFEQYKKLHKTSSARLYEILVKSFKDRDEWPINIQSLAEKITFEKRAGAKDYYASDVLRYLKPSINEINKKTDLCIDFQFNKENDICIFKKLKKPKQFLPAKKADAKQKKAPSLAKQMATCMEEFKILSSAEQKQIRDEIKQQQLFKFMPDEETRIFTYMNMRKQQSTE